VSVRNFGIRAARVEDDPGMEQPLLAHLGDAGLAQFTLVASSKSRAWTGLQASIHHSSGGLVKHRPCFLHYGVCMNVGSPVTSIYRRDGVTHRGLHSPGQIDIIPFGEAIEWEEGGPSTSILVRLMPSLLESTADAMGLSMSALSIKPQLQIRDPKLEHICWALKAELETGDPRERLYAEGLGTAIAAQLLRRYARTGGAMPQNGLSRRQLRTAIEFINSHLASDLSLAEIAAFAGMSASYFKTLFKRSTGMPVHQYVMRQRVERAVDLISRARVRLSAAALQAGFADQSHMARCMRRIMGVTPTEIVRNAR
jgi:AraC family transcriptional regulator